MFVSKRSLGVLPLITALLGLTALMSSSAQAEVGAKWNVAGTGVTLALSPALQIKEIEQLKGAETKYVALLEPTFNFELRCTGMELVGANLQPEGSISSGMKIKWSGCVFKSKGETIAACEPLFEGKEKGVVVSNGLKGLIVLHEKSPLIRLTPVSGEIFVEAKVAAECAIGVAFRGQLTLKDATLSTESVTHLVVEGPLGKLLYGELQTTLCANIVLELAGKHQGLKWSGVAG